MDEQKDTHSQTQRKDISVFSKDTHVDPFGQNVSSSRAYARAERIAGAVHLITNSVPETEDLRHSARSVSYALVQSTMRLNSGFRGENHPAVQEIAIHARALVTILRLMQLSGHVSVQNMDLIIHALEDLLAFVKSSGQSLLSERMILSKNDLIPEESTHTKHIRPVVPKHERRSVVHRSNNESHNPRRETIVALLKESGALGIKDIASHIIGCSEKTVQRELAALTAAGQVSKTGEKRWSRYTLVG